MNRTEAVVEAAKAWFQAKRPEGMDLSDQLNHPVTGCTNRAEQELAVAVADLISFLQYDNWTGNPLGEPTQGTNETPQDAVASEQPEETQDKAENAQDAKSLVYTNDERVEQLADMLATEAHPTYRRRLHWELGLRLAVTEDDPCPSDEIIALALDVAEAFTHQLRGVDGKQTGEVEVVRALPAALPFRSVLVTKIGENGATRSVLALSCESEEHIFASATEGAPEIQLRLSTDDVRRITINSLYAPPDNLDPFNGLVFAVRGWWEAARPEGWTLEEHLLNPTVSLASIDARRIAVAFAQLIEAQHLRSAIRPPATKPEEIGE